MIYVNLLGMDHVRQLWWEKKSCKEHCHHEAAYQIFQNCYNDQNLLQILNVDTVQEWMGMASKLAVEEYQNGNDMGFGVLGIGWVTAIRFFSFRLMCFCC